MKLSEHRQKFTADLAKLIQFANGIPGWSVAIDEVKRSKEEAERRAALAKQGKGVASSNSLHIEGLAVDLLLYVHGEYRTQTSDYRVLGEFWLTLDPLNKWGGVINDGNHFSRSYDKRI